jgi:hypothetical protein
MIAFAIGPALLVNALVVLPLVGLRAAAIHSVFISLAVIVAAQFASLLVDSVPFTRAYPPGHTKLKTRWPLYLLGMFTLAYWPVQAELAALQRPGDLLLLIAIGIAAVGILEVIGHRVALRWTVQPDAEFGDDPESMTTLNLGPVET